MAKMDSFANKFYGSVTESAANTLTFNEIPTNENMFGKRAWILHRLEWYLVALGWTLLDADDDVITAALTSSDKLDSLALDDAGVIDLLELQVDVRTAVGFARQEAPIMRDFSSLPGGGLIIAPRPLYLAVKGTSLGQAVTIAARGYFTTLDLTPADYLELVDFYRIVR